jgi:YNFM family putative membrane transporter
MQEGRTSVSQAESALVHDAPPRLQRGTPEFRRANRALFLAGFATFAMVYTVQPLLPLFSSEFGISAALSSWSLSVTTAALAICLLLAGAVSDRYGRNATMSTALLVSALCTMACAAVGSFPQLLVLRGVLGIAVAGVPAVAMAYLSEEFDPASLGYSMGLYIGGNALGGMTGRVVSGVLSDHFGWRTAVAVIGVAALLVALEFRRSLPAPRHFRQRRVNLLTMFDGAGDHFRDRGLRKLFLIGFLLVGVFISVYNYLGFRLAGPEFGLSQSAVSLLFSLYLMGVFSSVWIGRLSDRLGRRRVLWIVVLTMLTGLLLTLAHAVALIVMGVALLTFGFFGGHSIASSWVGRRALQHRALASALYLSCYYLGSSVIGSLSGLVWEAGGWSGVVLALGLCLGVSLLLSLSLRRLPVLA